MATSTRLSRTRVAVLLLLTGLVYAIELQLLRRLQGPAAHEWLVPAAAFDLAVAVPLLWWAFGFRGAPQAGRRLFAVVLASLAGAALVLPEDGRRLVSLLRIGLAPVEIVVVGTAVRAAVRLTRDARTGADLFERIETAFAKALGDSFVSRLLAAEISALFFALHVPRRETAPGSFTLGAARLPAVVAGLAIAMVVEGVAVHAVVAATHPHLAWALTAIDAYALLWIVGNDRAIAGRVVAVEPEALVLRAGLRLTARVPWSRVEGTSEASAPGDLDVARPAEANVTVRFRGPVEVTGFLGRRRKVTGVRLCVDDPEGLRATIAARSA